MTDEAIHLSNNPPLVDNEAIALRHKEAFVCATAVLNAEYSLPVEIANEDDLAKMTKHVKDARSAGGNLETARETEKRPFLDAGTAIQNLFKPRIDKLEASRKLALKRIDAWNTKVEEKRRVEAKIAADKERKETSRLLAAAASIESQGMADVAATIMDSALDSQASAEKLDRVSTGSAADLVRTHTEAGTVTSATTLTFEIVDNDALRATLGALGGHFSQPEIEKAVRSYIAASKKLGATAATIKPVAGVRFFDERSARVR